MATTDTKVFTNTTVFQSEKVSEGEWKITEIPSDPPAEQDLHSGNRKELNFDLVFGIGVSEFNSLSSLLTHTIQYCVFIRSLLVTLLYN